MTLTPEDLAKIEARVNAATEGPWTVMDGIHSLWVNAPESCEHIADVFRRQNGINNGINNCVFIANARQDIPALIAALKEAWAENERIKKQAAIARDVYENDPH